MDDWRVLVAEDDRTVARIHCRYVSARPGFAVAAVASNGAEAVRLLEDLQPALVLLDLGLPGVDGISLLRQLRLGGSSVEVIVITAHASPKIVQAVIQLGVVDYLVKPFWPARLGEALDTFTIRSSNLSGRALTQTAIDRVRRGESDTPRPPMNATTERRLHEVQATLATASEALSAERVAALTGMSRVTARRYLEHLVAIGYAAVDLVPNGPGRPRKVYRIWLSSPVSDAGPPAPAHRGR